ncbi:uncharacterized protein LOC126581740 [Anopheles aquasalis]|uniref:uncharacterized protein LOC126581740 n=1 Tax=Anopheles aquasalis TaxID=42839 RepID=UPI00215AEE03|nr:uncharacterized protein LOC126581740 [Anopheles aquasalis]
MFAERSTLCRLYNTLIFMQLLYVTRAFGVIFEEYVVDQGRNLTLRCDSRHPVRWVREGRREDVRQFQTDGSLVLTNLTAQDSGRYTCSAAVPTLTTVTVLEETVPSGDDGDGDGPVTNGTVGAGVAATALLDSVASPENATSESMATDGAGEEEEEEVEVEEEEQRGEGRAQPESFVELLKVNVKVRTPPLAVSNFYVRASTIIAVLVWEVMPNRTGGYAIRDFTAEMRRMRDPSGSDTTVATDAPELPWETIDPRHISPNARQLEIYHLIPNTTYEFRIWGNNQLGAGEIVTILATTQPRMEEKDLVRRIMVDAKNFDTRVWIAAVGIVMGTLVILSLGTCIVLYKECREPAVNDKDEELDSLELVPNIILNPGFCDSDDQGQHPLSPPVPRTLPYGHRYGQPGYIAGGPHAHRLGAGGLLPNGAGYGGGMAGILAGATATTTTTTNTNNTTNATTNATGATRHAGTAGGGGADDEDDDDEDEDEEPMTFSRRMSIFFTGNTIKRI